MTHTLGDQRLLQLAKHLASHKRGLQQFNFRVVCQLTRCGSSGCAIGEMPAVWPGQWTYVHHNLQSPCIKDFQDVAGRLEAAAFHVYLRIRRVGAPVRSCDHAVGWIKSQMTAWFDINDEQFIRLFTPDYASSIQSRNSVRPMGGLPDTASARQVAQHIRAFVAARNPKRKAPKKAKV